jgi:DHA1 family bicyclomycin/chloramphenicol resistance-like MFS transporter
MEKRKHNVLILILGLLSAIGPFSIDMYLPGFPSIARDLQTTVDGVAYSLSSFFIGVCIGQLLCGPLLDRFGRRLPLIIGLAIYIVASIGCALSTSIEALIGFRFLQALGGCVGMVAPNAIVRDVFPVDRIAKVYSLLILILGVSPILAPTVGSYVIAIFGWPIVFAVLAIAALILLITVITLLPESRKGDPEVSLRPTAIAKGYFLVLQEVNFRTYAVSGAVASAGIFAYLAGSPFVFMNLYGVSETQYGLIFGAIAAGLIASSQINNTLLKRYSSEQILKRILLAQAATGLLLVLGAVMNVLSLYSTIGLMFLFVSLQGFTFPNCAALAMAPFSKGVGSASAMLGALQMIFGATASALVGLFFNETAVPLVIVMASCSTLGLITLLLGSKSKSNADEEIIAEETVNMIENF